MKPLNFKKKPTVATKSIEERIAEAKTISDIKVLLLELVPKKQLNTRSVVKASNGRKFDNR